MHDYEKKISGKGVRSFPDAAAYESTNPAAMKRLSPSAGLLQAGAPLPLRALQRGVCAAFTWRLWFGGFLLFPGRDQIRQRDPIEKILDHAV